MLTAFFCFAVSVADSTLALSPTVAARLLPSVSTLRCRPCAESDDPLARRRPKLGTVLPGLNAIATYTPVE